jgi:hypothetical protein
MHREMHRFLKSVAKVQLFFYLPNFSAIFLSKYFKKAYRDVVKLFHSQAIGIA